MHVDLDNKVEEEEVTDITEIFRSRSEEYFREREHPKLIEVCRYSGQVVTLGGGAVCGERNRDLPRHSGKRVVIAAIPDGDWQGINVSDADEGKGRKAESG